MARGHMEYLQGAVPPRALKRAIQLRSVCDGFTERQAPPASTGASSGEGAVSPRAVKRAIQLRSMYDGFTERQAPPASRDASFGEADLHFHEGHTSREIDIGRIACGEEKRRTVMLRNLHRICSSEDLLKHIKGLTVGMVVPQSVHVPMCRNSKRSKGFGFVQCKRPEDVGILAVAMETHRSTPHANAMKSVKMVYAAVQGQDNMMFHIDMARFSAAQQVATAASHLSCTRDRGEPKPGLRRPLPNAPQAGVKPLGSDLFHASSSDVMWTSAAALQPMYIDERELACLKQRVS